MLADTFNDFKSAVYLDISEPQRQAFIKTLDFMECGKITHILLDKIEFSDDDQMDIFCGLFNLSAWIDSDYKCGTVGCIGGTAELLCGVSFDGWEDHPRLAHLFNPTALIVDFDSVTVQQAAKALRGFLTTGEADWSGA